MGPAARVAVVRFAGRDIDDHVVESAIEFQRGREFAFVHPEDAEAAVVRQGLASARLEAATTELARLDALAKKQQSIGLLEDALQRPFDAISTVEHDPKLQAAKEK